MAETQYFDLGRTLMTAEALKGARRQSTVDRLREQYLGTQNQALQQDIAAQSQAQTQASSDREHKRVYAGSQAVMNSSDPKGMVEALFPQLVQQHEAQFGAGSWQKVTPEQIKADAQKYGAIAAAQLGIDPSAVNGDLPASAREYQFAVKNGFKGSFQEWITAGGQTSRPSSVQEWDFYNTLPEESKRLYLEMKRNPNMQVREIGGAQTVVAPSLVGGTTMTQLSSLPQEAAAAGTIKRSEAEGAAIGKAEGEITGGIQTKGANAVGTVGLLNVADPLIDVATGSQSGAARDQLAAFFGKSTSGAEAIAQLRVLQAGLMTSMPRMEGPQSDRDVQLYREAAGQIGDPTVPAPIKKAAVQTIRQIQERYIQRAGGQNQPARVQSDADYDALPSGTTFIAPDGTQRRKP